GAVDPDLQGFLDDERVRPCDGVVGGHVVHAAPGCDPAHVPSLGRVRRQQPTSACDVKRRSLPDGVLGMVPGSSTTTLRGRTLTSETTAWATWCLMRRTLTGSCQALDSTATANVSR